MGPPDPAYLKKYLRCIRWTCGEAPKTCIETGTYQGDGAQIFSDLFPMVHTIELSQKWYEFSRARLAGRKNIICHQGDSAEVLARVVPSISGPAVFYLDAHFAGGDTAFGKEEVPLLRELETICRRPYSDLIIIDDLRMVGQAGETGSSTDPKYPLMTYDWRAITIEKMVRILQLRSRSHWFCEKDRLVIYTNLSWIRAVCLKLVLWGYQFLWRFVRQASRILKP